MERDPLVYIDHILDSIDLIDEFTQGMSLENFLEDTKTQDSVMRRLEIIGEATNKVVPEIQEVHPEVPWRMIVGMRNLLIHEYFAINNKLVWGTIKTKLPLFRDQILNIKKELEAT